MTEFEEEVLQDIFEWAKERFGISEFEAHIRIRRLSKMYWNEKLSQEVILAVHFVGFRGDEYNRAQKVWKVDFVHVCNDRRFEAEVFEGDVVVFANGYENKRTEFVRDDSAFFQN